MELKLLTKKDHVNIFQIIDEKEQRIIISNQQDKTYICDLVFVNGDVDYKINNITEKTSYKDFDTIAGKSGDINYYNHILENLKWSCEPIFDVKQFDIEHFNYWFCEIYNGYSKHPNKTGEKGIFLRTDKLSINMIKNYVQYFNCEVEDEIHLYDLEGIIRKDWIKKINKR